MMKQDIRELLKPEEVISTKKLPESHRDEFYRKLKASRQSKGRSVNRFYMLKMAAALVMFAAVGVILFKSYVSPSNKIAETSAIEQQIKQVEKEYLTSIDKEWKSFVALADDEQLITRYQEKLSDLNSDYQVITSKFKQDTNNVFIIEELVNNLQMRLQLLKDIQEHIKLLNQENGQHATTTI